MIERLHWLGHAGFYLEGSPAIYIDPFQVGGGPTADLVLLTHSHYDHCSRSDLEKLVDEDTEVLCPRDCLAPLRDLPGGRRLMQPGAKVTIRDVTVEGVPAYTRRSRMHARQNGWLGYVVEVGGVRWYHAGDTDYIPEMRDLQVDIACLPISGGETMNVVEAAAAANCIGPDVVVPMHYGTLTGTDVDPEALASLTRVAVHTLERDPAFAADP